MAGRKRIKINTLLLLTQVGIFYISIGFIQKVRKASTMESQIGP